MNGVERRRLRAPVVTGVCGAGLTVAVALAAGAVAAAPVAAITAVAAFVYYRLARTESDVGALLASQPDERQTNVRVRVRALAGAVLLAVGAIGGIVAAVLNQASWPYALVVGLGALCFLGAVGFYRYAGHVRDGGLAGSRMGRVDERQVAVLLNALQFAGIVMFVVAAVLGVALSNHTGADSLRILALTFAVAVILAFWLFRPHAN